MKIVANYIKPALKSNSGSELVTDCPNLVINTISDMIEKIAKNQITFCCVMETWRNSPDSLFSGSGTQD